MTTTTLPSFETYANNVMELRYSHIVHGRKETWEDIAHRVVDHVISANITIPTMSASLTDSIFEIIRDRKFIPGGRILSQAGRQYHQTDSCFCLQVEDTREGWAELLHKCTMMFMSGGGVGVDYSQVRPYGTMLKKSGGISSGPIPLIHAVDSIGAAVRQGGERRGAIYASLNWDHADIQQFIHLKNGNDCLQHTNISVRFNKEWQEAYQGRQQAQDFSYKNTVFYDTLQHACQWGDPGFQFDRDNQILRNACTEIISAHDSDSCCLGSINVAAINSLSELSNVVQLGTLFLLCNTLYTHTPTDKVAQVKQQNRRLGLGLMGVAEWFMQRGLPYGYIPQRQNYFENSVDFAKWLQVYKQASDRAADIWSDKLQISRPIALRAIAPTGTVSIAGGQTTPGIEPIFCQAYQRTYNTLKTQEYSNGYKKEIVIDPIVQKMLQQGHNVEDIDTAYSLAKSVEGIEKRIAFQALCQGYVDNAISSTVNLPQYVQGIEEKIAPILLKYLPQLRGITFYPDGRHDNQPVQQVDIKDALKQQNILEQHESCKGDGCSI